MERRRRWVLACLVASFGVMLGWSPAVAGGDFVEDVPVIHALAGDGSTVWFGWAASELADVDGDDVTDFILSDPDRIGGASVAVYSGATASVIYTFVRPGDDNDYGFAIADAGDTDGDGTNDIVIGDPSDPGGSGRVELRSGATGELLHAFEGPAAGSAFGWAVAGAGDIDGDGHADVLVGAPYALTASGLESGRVDIYSGDEFELIRTVPGGAAGDHFGTGVDSVADVNGDGRPESVVGAADGGQKAGGEVALLSGADGSRLWVYDGKSSNEELGQFFVSGLDDLDGDGVADVYAGDYPAKSRGVGGGAAYVLSGRDGTIVHEWRGHKGDGTGPGREAGDLDGDGIQDLAVGAWTASDGAPFAGRLDIFSGADGKRLASATGVIAGANLGFDAIGLGDVNGDGRNDVLVTAATGGRAYVISGELVR